MRARRPRSASRLWRRGVTSSVCVAVLLGFGGVAWAGFNSQEVDSSNSFSAATLQLKAGTPDGSSCYSTGAGSGGTVAANVATCSGDPLPAGELSSSSASSATTSLTSVGSTGASSGSVSSAGCGVEAVTDSSSSGGDTGLVYGGVSFGTSFASPANSSFTSSAISFDGNSGSYVGTISSFTGPQTFSIVAWVNTTSSNGGSIVGFTDQQANGATNFDRLVWVDPTGRVVFGVSTSYNNQEVRSSAVVNDGTWHLVVATLSSSGMFLYVDNHSAVSNPYATSAGNYTGYWHLGWSPHSNWTYAPYDDYLNGSLAEVAILGTALSSSNVSTLYNASSASAYASTIASFSPTAYWKLSDTGITPYTGTIPALGSGSTTLADATGGGNTGYAQGAVTLGASGPMGGRAITLGGASGSYVETTTSYSNPGPLTELIWFQAPTSGAAGSLMGFTNLQTNATPSSWDRQLWIDPSGHIIYGIYPNSVQEVTSPGTYADGSWHFVAASYGPGGEQLFVDGTRVAMNSSATSAQNYSGYWHLGYSNATSGWSDPPSSNDWKGSLAQAAVIPTQLSASQIATLYTAGTSSAFRSDVLALSPTAYWPLDDSSTSLACTRVLVEVQTTVGTTTTCVYPAAAGACPTTPPTSAPLSSLGTSTMAAPGGSGLSLLVKMILSASSPAGVLGLHVLPGLDLAVTRSSWSAGLAYPSASVEL